MIKKNIKMQERNAIQNNLFFKYKQVKEKKKKIT